MIAKEEDNKQSSYMLSRDFSANTRQTCQHFLYKDGLNYLLHPSIPTRNENFNIAEIGVGTCMWLIEMSRQLPGANLDGYDISFDQCPPAEWLPRNISLTKRSIFDEPPPEVHEKYDVIHVQLFITCVRDGNPVPMLQNLLKMLKPGGYIQWGEWDIPAWRIVRTSDAPSTTNNELNELTDYLASLGGMAEKAEFFGNWIADLHQTFRANGLKEVVVDRREFAPEIAPLLLDTWMVASTEASYLLDKMGGGRGDKMRAMIAEVGKNRWNTTFNVDRVVTIGQKPFA